MRRSKEEKELQKILHATKYCTLQQAIDFGLKENRIKNLIADKQLVKEINNGTTYLCNGNKVKKYNQSETGCKAYAKGGFRHDSKLFQHCLELKKQNQDFTVQSGKSYANEIGADKLGAPDIIIQIVRETVETYAYEVITRRYTEEHIQTINSWAVTHEIPITMEKI